MIGWKKGWKAGRKRKIRLKRGGFFYITVMFNLKNKQANPQQTPNNCKNLFPKSSPLKTKRKTVAGGGLTYP